MAEFGWTEAEQQTCLHGFKLGYSFGLISSEMPGRSRNAVAGWLSRNGHVRAGKTQLKLKPVYAPRKRYGQRSRTTSTSRPSALAPPPLALPPVVVDARDYHRTFVRVIHLASDGCKYPVDTIGGPESGRHLFCNCKRRRHSPYCSTHSAIAFVAVRSRSGTVRPSWRKLR
jgi:hypothetical protein